MKFSILPLFLDVWVHQYIALRNDLLQIKFDPEDQTKKMDIHYTGERHLATLESTSSKPLHSEHGLIQSIPFLIALPIRISYKSVVSRSLTSPTTRTSTSESISICCCPVDAPANHPTFWQDISASPIIWIRSALKRVFINCDSSAKEVDGIVYRWGRSASAYPCHSSVLSTPVRMPSGRKLCHKSWSLQITKLLASLRFFDTHYSFEATRCHLNDYNKLIRER